MIDLYSFNYEFVNLFINFHIDIIYCYNIYIYDYYKYKYMYVYLHGLCL